MRVLGVLGLVAILAAAWMVPLPWAAESPGRVVAVGDDVTVSLLPPAQDAPAPPPLAPLTGSFLTSHPQGGRTLASVLGAWVSPGRVVRRARPEPRQALAQPGTIAALRGLGLSPVRMEGAPLPVRVAVGDTVDGASLGAWLHIFDTTSRLDVARGRTVAAIGRVASDESLACVPRPGDAVAAAQRAGAQVVVVAAACPDLPPGGGTVRAATFIDAVERLGAR